MGKESKREGEKGADRREEDDGFFWPISCEEGHLDFRRGTPTSKSAFSRLKVQMHRGRTVADLLLLDLFGFAVGGRIEGATEKVRAWGLNCGIRL